MSALYICKQHSADIFMNAVKETMSLKPAHSCFMYAIAKVKKKEKKRLETHLELMFTKLESENLITAADHRSWEWLTDRFTARPTLAFLLREKRIQYGLSD